MQLVVSVVSIVVLWASIMLFLRSGNSDYLGAVILSVGFPSILVTRTSRPKLFALANLALSAFAFGVFSETGGTISVVCTAFLAALAGRFSALADIKSGLVDLGPADQVQSPP